jgi:hypothetical protein
VAQGGRRARLFGRNRHRRTEFHIITREPPGSSFGLQRGQAGYDNYAAKERSTLMRPARSPTT